jgi:hypothetical protein
MPISINPQVTTNAAGSFGVTWDGLMQGTAMPAPNAMLNLAGGLVATAETDPMYGGIAISENIPLNPGSPPTTPDPSLGGYVARATNVSVVGAALSVTGFTVFDQDYSMINSPGSQVPLASAGMSVHFYRLGSGARIVVAIDPALVNLYGTIITNQVTWDFVNQRIIAFATTALPVKVLKVMPTNCMTVTFTPGSGVANWNRNGAAAVILI